jgi:regulator of sigma E protease
VRYLGFILSVTFVIAVHELGHVSIATLFGIKLERFALGLGPNLFSGRRRGTQLVLGAIPVGAFAQIRGMNPHAVNFDRRDPHSFASKGFWTRALIIAGGVLGNLVLTFVVLVGLYLRGTHVPVPMTIGTVEPGSQAAKAQLRPGDVILSIGAEPLSQWSQLVDFIAERPGELLTLRVRRADATLDIQLKPRADQRGKGHIGITQQYVLRDYTLGEALRRALRHELSLVPEGMWLIRQLARENVAGEMVHRLSAASVNGLDAWLRGIAALSLALGMFHLLPFPPLDGGRIALIALEALTRRSLHPRLESLLHAIGTIALIAGLGWLLARDVARLVIDGKFAGGAGADGFGSAPASAAPVASGNESQDAGISDGGGK